jgi:two-component system, NtrC family, response regulator HydG
MPSLAAIRGPLIGARVRLTPGATSVGRDGNNTVALADPSVAGTHCIVTSSGNLASIRNLDGAAPTFVNGLPCTDQPLQHGDQIQIGASLFVLDLKDDLADIDHNRVRTENRPAATPTLVIRREDVFGDKRLDTSGSSADRLSHDLAALIRITAAVSAVQGLARLERPLLELIAETVPADRGALILTESGSADRSAAFGWARGGASAAAVHAVSRPILDRVLDERVGVLGTEPREGADGPTTARSILGAPLMAFDKLLGAIILETDAATTAFDEGHLRLVMAIAGVVANALEQARHIEWLEGENRTLRAALHGEHNMVGKSASMLDLFRRIVRVAATDSTVLIRGESGTGKELVALAIHRNSGRSDRPFVAINCAAIVETLLESELFGHERGAFTGAVAQKKGKLEAAEGGTVFLDEVGELSQGLQAKLLRVLQHREFERVGGTRRVHVNFRLIAATNRDLEAAIAAGAFRRDLYYRLNVISLETPPLRERREDIPVLASFLARRHAQALNRPVSGISPEALACLTAYEWPGNVRELDNAIEHAVVLGATPLILPEDLPDVVAEAGSLAGSSVDAAPSAGPFHDAVKRAKRDVIRKAVAQAGGNYSAAARLLGLHPNYLHRLLRNLQLKAELKDQQF